MKELTETERRFHLANCCQWKFAGYSIDDEGMPKDCVLGNETNPYLPHKVRMVPERTCRIVYREGVPACSECGRELAYDSRFCDCCGAKVVTR